MIFDTCRYVKSRSSSALFDKMSNNRELSKKCEALKNLKLKGTRMENMKIKIFFSEDFRLILLMIENNRSERMETFTATIATSGMKKALYGI